MKDNRWNLITALCNLTAGICFILVALKETDMADRILFFVASAGFLLGSVGFFGTYAKNLKV